MSRPLNRQDEIASSTTATTGILDLASPRPAPQSREWSDELGETLEFHTRPPQQVRAVLRRPALQDLALRLRGLRRASPFSSGHTASPILPPSPLMPASSRIAWASTDTTRWRTPGRARAPLHHEHDRVRSTRRPGRRTTDSAAVANDATVSSSTRAGTPRRPVPVPRVSRVPGHASRPAATPGACCDRRPRPDACALTTFAAAGSSPDGHPSRSSGPCSGSRAA